MPKLKVLHFLGMETGMPRKRKMPELRQMNFMTSDREEVLDAVKGVAALLERHPDRPGRVVDAVRALSPGSTPVQANDSREVIREALARLSRTGGLRHYRQLRGSNDVSK